MNRIVFFLSVLLPLTSLAVTTGPRDSYSLVFDLKEAQMVYNYDIKNFEPYIIGTHDLVPAKSFFIDKNKYSAYQLLIKSENEGTFLFLNGSLNKTLTKGKWEILPVGTLESINKSNEVLITYYNVDPTAKIEVHIGFSNANALALPNTQLVNKTTATEAFTMKPRKFVAGKDGLISFIFIVFAFATILSGNYTRAFERFFSVSELLNFVLRDTSFLINKPLSRINMNFVIFLSLLSGYLFFVLYNSEVNNAVFDWLLFKGRTYPYQILNFLILSVVSFASYILKLMVLNITGRLFNLEKTVEIHFFRIIQYNIVVFSIIAIFIFVMKLLYLPFEINFASMAVTLSVFIYFGRFINLSFTINRTAHVSTLYLISYLCLVEILPVVIGIKFLLFQ